MFLQNGRNRLETTDISHSCQNRCRVQPFLNCCSCNLMSCQIISQRTITSSEFHGDRLLLCTFGVRLVRASRIASLNFHSSITERCACADTEISRFGIAFRCYRRQVSHFCGNKDFRGNMRTEDIEEQLFPCGIVLLGCQLHRHFLDDVDKSSL